MLLRLVPWLVLVFVALVSLRAEAQSSRRPSSRVVVLEPRAPSGALADALRRTRAELTAEGFDVVAAPLSGTDTRRALEDAAANHDAEAAIAIESIAGGAEVWVTDRITGKTLVRTVDVRDQPIDEQPRVLAIRAVELLRASLVEAVVLPPPKEGASLSVPPDIERFVAPELGPLAGVSAQLSGALLTGFDGIGPAGGPALRIGYGLEMGLFARLAWAGPAFGMAVEGPLGEAVVREEMLTLDIGYAPGVSWAGFSPLVWLGAGFHHLAASGELSEGFVGTTSDVWAAAIVGGVGMGYRITPRLMVLLDAEALVALPRPVVTMAGERLATTGRPSLLATLGVVIRF